MLISASVGFVFGVARRYFIRIRAITMSPVLHRISNRKHQSLRPPLSHMLELVTNERGTRRCDVGPDDNYVTNRNRGRRPQGTCKQPAQPRYPSPLHENNAVR